MKLKTALLFCVLFFIADMVFAQEPEIKSVAVTVYNSSFGVIKDTRVFNLKKGASKIKLTDVAQEIDPTSVHIKFDGQALEQNYQYDLAGISSILEKYIDRNVRLTSGKGELIEGKLLSYRNGGQIVIEKKEGGLVMFPARNDYLINVERLPEGLITRPTLVWDINSNREGKQDVEVTYQTGGMNWHAEYVAVIDKNDKMMDLNSWVSVENNSGAAYKNAKLKLVAGDVNMVKPKAKAPKYEKGYGVDYSLIEVASKVKPIQEKEFFEYHIYDVQNPVTISQNESKQISLFEASNIKITKKYLLTSGANDETGEQKASVMIELENKEGNNLGMPMPKGRVRIYKADGETSEFIGEDKINHTPKNEKITLKTGNAFDVLAEIVNAENKAISKAVSENTYKVVVKNRKNEEVEVNFEKTLNPNSKIVKSSLSFEKKNANIALFKIPVKKDSESVLTFTVRNEMYYK
jgi:hypothetical protein